MAGSRSLPLVSGPSVPMSLRTPAQALAEILARVHPLGTEMVDVLDACGRVLAEDVTAERDLPPWDNSAMDGYAVHSASVRAGVPLEVSATVAAGAQPGAVPAGCAARIMTGAPMPPGADAVLMREETDETDPAHVTLQRVPAPGDNVRRRGEDVPCGRAVLPRGTVVHPADVGLLCAVGRARARVHRRPVVSILATGDELAEVGAPPSPTRIVNSNAWMLAAQVREAGAIPRVLPVAPDKRDALADALAEARQADALVTTGGVSVGDFDFVKDALADAGAVLSFWRVAIRPGRPLAVGTLGETAVFGLPGNPVSTFVTCEVFVCPALRRMLGAPRPRRRTVRAVLRGRYGKKPGLTHYVRVRLERLADGTAVAVLQETQSSGSLSSMALADGLMVVPEAQGDLSDGAAVEVMALRDGWEG
ncbi:MAG: molybdopterin molybdotransferase MoeA [Deltaproteobacteria bacterium]|nr:molybdopterin molybdotransferase MoeA [Deltaproteobacteria bacterium]